MYLTPNLRGYSLRAGNRGCSAHGSGTLWCSVSYLRGLGSRALGPEAGPGYILGPTPRDPLLLVGPYLLKIPQLPKTVPAARDQVFKHMGHLTFKP